MKWSKLIDRRLIKNIDLGLIISMLLLISIGIVAIVSSTGIAYGSSYSYIKVQIIALILGVIGIVAVLFFDYNTFGEMEKDYICCQYTIACCCLFVWQSNKRFEILVNIWTAEFSAF